MLIFVNKIPTYVYIEDTAGQIEETHLYLIHECIINANLVENHFLAYELWHILTIHEGREDYKCLADDTSTKFINAKNKGHHDMIIQCD